ncbi:MAG: right-handed parallel beta-helix repeat-containing protein, partial [Candidatus Heimdallarchaeaceae archaeon]
MKKLSFSILFVILVVTSISNYPINIQSATIYDEKKIDLDNFSIKNLVSSDSIVIYSDTDLLEYNFPGNGTIDDPFRIEDLLIEDENYGIYINSAKHYFVIQNCHITNAGFGGIVIKNTHSGYGNISNNVIEYCNTTNGIYLQSCSEVNLENNTCIGNAFGIQVKLSSNCTIIDNTCANNIFVGIYIQIDSPGCLLENNSIRLNGDFGILCSQSRGALIYNNSLEDNQFGIFEDTLEDYRDFEVIGNTLGGMKIVYLTDEQAQTINDMNICMLFLINCSKIMVENLIIEQKYIGIFSFGSNNCTYQNNIFFNNELIGLYIYNSNFTTISNNSFTNYVGGNGFSVRSSFYFTLRDNVFLFNGLSFDDIDVQAVSTILLENNTINGREIGFFLDEISITISDPDYGQLIFYNCSEVLLQNQNMHNTPVAIAIIESRNFIVSNCEIFENAIGLTIIESENITVDICSLYDNYYAGISMFRVVNLNLTNSIIDSNLDVGIEARACANLSINYCEIINNEFGLIFVNIDNLAINGSLFSNNSRMNMYLYELHVGSITNLEVYDGDYGIYFNLADNCLVQNCDIKDANIDGVYMLDSYRIYLMHNNISLNFYGVKAQDSSYGQFLYNTFAGNSVYAISLDKDTDHNLIHHNIFNLNQVNDVTGRLSQCRDDGYNNTFYDVVTFEGNWWSNIEGYAYHIAGYAYSVDIFPLNPV